MRIVPDPVHGLNPGIELCFFCNKEKSIVLFGSVLKGERAPHKAVYDYAPCEACAKLMRQGVLLISVDEKKSMCREHTCRRCNHVWRAPIRMSKNTANLSGEMTETCPKCNTCGSINSSPHMLDDKNPWRTGGWVVVKDAFIQKVFQPEVAIDVIKKRVAFLSDEAWDLFGLPRGEVKENEEVHGDEKEG